MKNQDPQSRQGPSKAPKAEFKNGGLAISHRVAWVVLVISLCASTVAWLISLRVHGLADEQRLGDETASIGAALSERLAVYENVLHGAAGLFEASVSVERLEWRAYLNRVSIDERYPGIDALGYAVWIRRSDIESFVRETRADHAPEFEIRSPGDGNELLIVKYLEPEALHQESIGLDLNADPERRAVAERCRASGQAVISGQVSLPEPDGAEPQTGFLMLVPIYRKGTPTDTMEQRVANCEGFVYGRFVMEELMKEVSANRQLTVRVQVVDRSGAARERVIFDTGEVAPGYTPRLSDEVSLSVGGRSWVLRCYSTPEFDAYASKLGSLLVGGGGLLVSLLFFGIAWSLSHTRQRAVAIASGMTAKLRRTNEQLQQEIIDREKAQRSIKDSEALYHSLVKSLPLNIVRKDMEGRFTFANQRFCNELGRSVEDILGKTEFDLFPAEQAARHKQEDDRITETGNGLDAVQELRLSGEETRFVQVIKTPLRDGVGEVIGLQTISWDVTDKHQMEQELQHERYLLHTLLDNVPDRVYFKDERSRFLRVSRAMLELFKVDDPSAVIGKSDFDFFGEQHARQAYEDEQRIIRTGQPVIGLVEREDMPDGPPRWASTTKMPMRNSEGRVIGTFGVSRDITQMIEAETELQHERDLLHTLLDNSRDRIYFKDKESRFLRVSRAMAGFHNVRSPSDMVGKTDFDFFTEEHARQAFEDEQRIIRTGEPIIGLVEKETFPGGAIRWASTTKMPLRNERGEIVGTFGISRDITEMKKASEALREAKEAAEQANQTKSQFLASMSHELRTPLNSIIGFSNILVKNREGRLGESDLSFLERVLANGKHLLELINQILDLSKIEARKVELDLSWVNLDALVRKTVEQQEGLVRERPVKLRCDLPQRVEPIQTDPEKLKQVLINLIGNALKFTEQGSVTVRVITDAQAHRPVRIDVVDTGLGIPKDKLKVVFDAFQQADGGTTRRFEGTGLGLTISQALCGLMGYHIEVSSEIGQGSTFSIVLASRASTAESPVGQQPSTASPAVPIPKAAVARVKGRRVLVIDDEQDSRMLLRHALQELGCEVLEAASGEEGLTLARRSHPHLITVDLMMPRMTGAEVVGAIKSDPELKHIPVVVVSIVSGEHRGHILGAVDLLQKPIVREELLTTLQRNLPRRLERILVVDDEEDSRQLMRSLLEPEKFEVLTAANGQEALDRLEQSPCDLVLLDLVMPEMDGFTFLRLLRARPDCQNLPVVVVTAKDLTRPELEELRQNTSDVVQKSAVFEQDLRSVLNRLFQPPESGAAPPA